jgi:hypothetical protein
LTVRFPRIAGSWLVRVLGCLLVLIAVTARGQETAAPDWTVENFRWTGPLAPATAVEVVNPYGDVRLRAADAGEVEVSAMMQRRTSDAAKAAVELGRRRSRLTIAVVYPLAPQGDLHRVDLVVFVPAGAPLAVRTRDGMIQARGLANDVELESAGGDVFLSTSGTARVSAGRGDISAELRGDRWARAPRLATREGDITLRLPATADARVRIRAPGKISIDPHARLERRTARGARVTLGHGTRSLSLKTRRGSVTLLAPAP